MAESGRKKRKMGIINEEEKKDDDDDDKEEEEEKVEKFFALIRSTKEMRDRLRNAVEPNGSKVVDEEYQKLKKQDEKAGQWNPTFLPEDFMEGSISRSKNNPNLVSNDAGPSSKTQNEPEKEIKDDDDDGGEEDHGGANLDLKLSLSL